jgi:hypothetical protein
MKTVVISLGALMLTVGSALAGAQSQAKRLDYVVYKWDEKGGYSEASSARTAP